MTQDGPYQGQPSQPGPARGSDEPARGSDEQYQEPADPWGEQQPDSGQRPDSWGGTSLSTSPGATPGDYGSTGTGYPAPPYPPVPHPTGLLPTGLQPAGMEPPWGAPVPPRRRGPGAPIVALVVVLGLLICGGFGTAAWIVTHTADDRDPAMATSTPPNPAPATTAAQPTTTQDARFVVKGQCIRNEGTADAPQMSIVACAADTYEVLARLDGRTTGKADAEIKCARVKHYTKWYLYDSELDSLDFVLCLREY